ncbi:Uncharacterized protein APZ42_024420, partial [Daphnia magna]
SKFKNLFYFFFFFFICYFPSCYWGAKRNCVVKKKTKKTLPFPNHEMNPGRLSPAHWTWFIPHWLNVLRAKGGGGVQ